MKRTQNNECFFGRYRINLDEVLRLLFTNAGLEAVACIAKEKAVISICDNTLATPYLLRS